MDEIFSLPTVAGLEHELATTSFDRNGTRINPRAEHDAVLEIAKSRHPYLWGRRGIYLGNSLNLYEDASNGGAHLEVATPECSSPAELVAHSEAAQRIVQDLFECYRQRETALRSATLYRHSVDYTNGVSWATHLSVLSASSMKMLLPHLTAHLVSKLIYAGSGGFALNPSRTDFCLAPRVNTFTCVDSGAQTERDRGLVGGEKDNHCPGGLHRLHFLCHENLCSPLAKYLDVGSSMLIVRMLNVGVVPSIQLKDPMRALRLFETDPFCKAVALIEGGKRMSAVEIQRVYLETAERNLAETWMPAWATEFCAIWRRTLDQITEAAPWSVSDRLDWAAKYTLFAQHADGHHRGSWSAARAGLMELDMRFGEAGSGIYDQLQASGMIDGAVPGAGAVEVESAKKTPPAETRALFRGEWIQKLHAAATPGYASWTWVEDESNGMLLDLHDPWGREAAWRRSEGREPDIFQRTIARQRRHSSLRSTSLQEALRRYERGEIRAAFKITSTLHDEMAQLSDSEARQCLECRACSAARLGKDVALEALAELELHVGGRTQGVIGHRLFVLRVMSLLPVADEIQRWIAETDELPLGGVTDRDPVLLIDLAACMNRLGKPALAQKHLDDALPGLTARTRYHGRAIAERAESLRLAGSTSMATSQLEVAASIQESFRADLADHTLTYQAKLQGGEAGRELLQQAIQFQRCEEMPVAEVRSLLLDARLGGAACGVSHWKRIHELREATPALRRDSTLDKMLAHWQTWISQGEDPEGSGDFYWRL